jgi:hypothetical protein
VGLAVGRLLVYIENTMNAATSHMLSVSISFQVRDSLGGCVGPNGEVTSCQEPVEMLDFFLRRWECEGHKPLPARLRKQAVQFAEDAVSRIRVGHDYGEALTVGCTRQIDVVMTYKA